MAQEITVEQLTEDLHRLGVEEGDLLYVHSSLKKIGWLSAGAGTLYEALLRAVGAEGTIAVPTHTLSFVEWGKPPYDPKETPTMLGAFPDFLWRQEGAFRSLHPSHSSAAVGRLAHWLTDHHDPQNALGENSPLYRMAQAGGKILLLGVTHTANTTLHLAERLSGVPYVKLHYDASWGSDTWGKQPDGSVHQVTQTEFPGCSDAFDRIAPALSPITRQGLVGNAPSMLLDADAMIQKAVELLRKTPDFFLCDSPNCPCCPARRELLKKLSAVADMPL